MRGDRPGIDARGLHMLQQRPVHRRHRRPEAGLLPLHRLEHGGGIESRQQHHPHARQHPRVHLAGLRGRVEQRQRNQDDVLRHARLHRRLEHVAGRRGVQQHVGVGELRAFRVTGGPGGVEDHRGIVHPPPPRAERPGGCGTHRVAQRRHARDRARRVRRRHHQEKIGTPRLVAGGLGDGRERELGGAFERDQCLGVAVFEVVRHLTRLQQHVQRHHHRSGFEDAVVGDGKPRQIRTTERHVLAGRDPDLYQRRRHALRVLVDLRVGQRPAGAGDGAALGHHPRRVIEDGSKVQSGGVVTHAREKLPQPHRSASARGPR